MKPHSPYKEGGEWCIKTKIKGEESMKQHLGSWEATSGSWCSLTVKPNPKLAICKAKQSMSWHHMRFWWNMLKWWNPVLSLQKLEDTWMKDSGMAEIDNQENCLSSRPAVENPISQVYIFQTIKVVVFSGTFWPLDKWSSQVFLQWIWCLIGSILYTSFQSAS